MSSNQGEGSSHKSFKFAETLTTICNYSFDDFDDDDDAEEQFVDRSRPRSSVAAESFDPAKYDIMEFDSREDSADSKTPDQMIKLEKMIENNFLLKCLDKDQRDLIIQPMKEVLVRFNEKIIKQGDAGNNFYMIEKGKFDVFVNDRFEMSYSDEGSFGELALMYNTPRAATIVCVSPDGGILWSLDRYTFRKIVLLSAFQRRRDYEDLLNNVPLLAELSPYERSSIADALSKVAFPDKAVIFEQGTEGNDMFFVMEGQVSIVRQEGTLSQEISLVEKGGYFGELAMITHNPRFASAIAVGDTLLAKLDRGAFERLMGPVLFIMNRNKETYRKRLINVFGSEDQIPKLFEMIALDDN